VDTKDRTARFCGRLRPPPEVKLDFLSQEAGLIATHCIIISGRGRTAGCSRDARAAAWSMRPVSSLS
jgi:hypothetical protein